MTMTPSNTTSPISRPTNLAGQIAETVEHGVARVVRPSKSFAVDVDESGGPPR
jgi:hypothetical protein